MRSTVEAVTSRVMESYALMFDDEAAETVRANVVSFIETMCRKGETDDNRLAVLALIHLRRSNGKALPAAPDNAQTLL